MPDKNIPLKVLIARLSPEKNVTLSFSHKLLFNLLNSRFKGAVFCDYFYFPDFSDFNSIKKRGFKGPFYSSGGVKLSDFDVVAVSNSFLPELFNLFHLHNFLGVKIKLHERLNDPASPFIVIGGINTPSIACVTGDISDSKKTADEGLSSCVDAIFMGEAEVNFVEFIGELIKNAGWRKNKYALLDKLSDEITGIYFPPKFIHEFEYINVLGENEVTLKKIRPVRENAACVIKTAIVKDINVLSPFNGYIYDDNVKDATAPVEITRGCPSMCSFCKEGYTLKPYRERSASKAVNAASEIFRSSGVSTINLYSYNFNDHSKIHEIVNGLVSRSLTPEVKSQRIDRALKMPCLLSLLAKLGSASPTFAIEGISARMRGYLSKGLDERAILDFASAAFKSVPRQIKFFFIITGLETNADLDEFYSLSSRIIKYRKELSKDTSLVFSFMPLVLCQKTPLMFASAPQAALIFKTIEKISKSLSGIDKLTVRTSVSMALYEITSIMEYGGREITGAIYETAVNDGFAFYEHVPDSVYKNFMLRIKKRGFSFSSFHAAKGPEHIFNSDDREYGVKKTFLYKAWLMAKEFKSLGRCARDGSHECAGCGACPAEDSVYKSCDILKAEKSLDAVSADKINRAARLVVFADTRLDGDLAHRQIIKLTGGTAFQIFEEARSKLRFDGAKFYGKNFYLINAPFIEAEKIKNKTPFKTLDFIMECNYIFAEVEFIALNTLKEKGFKIIENFFNRFNPKFKLQRINRPGFEKFFIVSNSDGLKKQPNMPVIMLNNDTGKIYSLFKNSAEITDIVKTARIIEYIKFYEYNVKDQATFCASCGRVMSAAAGRGGANNCFICDIFSPGFIEFD